MNPVEFADVKETMLIPDDRRSDIPSGRLAQLARAPRLQRGCRRFEPVIAHFLDDRDSSLAASRETGRVK